MKRRENNNNKYAYYYSIEIALGKPLSNAQINQQLSAILASDKKNTASSIFGLTIKK